MSKYELVTRLWHGRIVRVKLFAPAMVPRRYKSRKRAKAKRRWVDDEDTRQDAYLCALIRRRRS